MNIQSVSNIVSTCIRIDLLFKAASLDHQELSTSVHLCPNSRSRSISIPCTQGNPQMIFHWWIHHAHPKKEELGRVYRPISSNWFYVQWISDYPVKSAFNGCIIQLYNLNIQLFPCIGHAYPINSPCLNNIQSIWTLKDTSIPSHLRIGWLIGFPWLLI